MRYPGWKTLLALVLICFSLAVKARAQEGSPLDATLRQYLQSARTTEKIPVIVKMRDSAVIRGLAANLRQSGLSRPARRHRLIRTLQAEAEMRRPQLQALLEQQGIHRTRGLWLINGMAFEATPAQIEAIAALPEVAAVEYDYVIEEPRVETAQVSAPAEPNIDLVNAPMLWSAGYFGQGVTIAVVDSGVDLGHPDLGPRWRGGSNSWFDPNGEHPDAPHDASGHGTQITGLLVGGGGSGTVIGAAPEAQWIGVKVFNDAGTATASAIHAGFQWLLDPDGDPETDDAPDIVNNSWGISPEVGGFCDRDFQEDIQILKAAGIAVVSSAGNSGAEPATSISPANYPESLAAGSVGTEFSQTHVSLFSARGPSACDGSFYPDLMAPGYQVLTTGLFPSDPYLYVTGSSFAAPHVSGVLALLLSAFPDASIPELEQAILQSATDLGEEGPDNTYGHGLVNALTAFNDLAGVDNTPPSPPQLLLPADGATVGTTVTFSWLPASDADGDPVSQFLVYSLDPDFSSPASLPADPVGQAVLGAICLLLAGLPLSTDRRRKMAGLLLLAALMGLAACGGGGGSDDEDSDVPAEAQSMTVEGLTAGETYYWKVVARDNQGAEVASTIRSFRVE